MSQKFQKVLNRYNTHPKSVVSKVIVKIGEKDIFIPISAYADLAEVNDVQVATVDSDAKITIKGGGDASCYDAIILIRNEQIVSRKVTFTTFDDNWEETKYSFYKEK